MVGPQENTKIAVVVPISITKPAASNFIDSYVAFASTMPEVPRLYSRWGAVMAVATMLGKSCYLIRGHFKVHPNLYVMLIGSPGTGKGVTCGILQGILELAGYKAFAADRSSKEKFITDLADGFDFRSTEATDELYQPLDFGDSSPATRECFILAEEFNDFIGTNNLEFIGLLTKLWSYSGTYSNRLKTGRSVSIPEPCVNLFGGNTHSGFAMAFPPEVMGQGFLARMLLVYGETTGNKVTFPPPPDQQIKISLGADLVAIKSICTGEIRISDDAGSLLDEINQTWAGFKEDLRFQHYGSRRFTQLLKLCIIFSASRRSKSISVENVIDANTLLTDTEDVMQKALGEFGKARNADVNGKIMSALYETTRPLTIKDLWKLTSNDLDSMTELAKILNNLQSAEKIQHVKNKGYLPKLEEQKRDQRHTKPSKHGE